METEEHAKVFFLKSYRAENNFVSFLDHDLPKLALIYMTELGVILDGGCDDLDGLL